MNRLSESESARGGEFALEVRGRLINRDKLRYPSDLETHIEPLIPRAQVVASNGQHILGGMGERGIASIMRSPQVSCIIGVALIG